MTHPKVNTIRGDRAPIRRYRDRVTASSGGAGTPDVPSGLLDRPRLRDRILSLPPGEVLVVSSAPGYGATTALAQAMRASGDQVHWVAADPKLTDDDLRRALCEAVGADVSHGVDGALDVLDGGPPAWLVIDAVTPSVQPGFVSEIVRLAEYLPPHLRMVVAATAWLGPLPRAQRLTQAELALTDDEALALLTARQPGLDIDHADEIIGLCEGWAAALVAAGAAVDPAEAGTWLLGPGAAALFGGWLMSLSSPHRDFLLATRVLDQLCAANTAAVTGRADTAETLHALDVGRGYLVEVPPAVPETGRWWRRHRLLTAYLDQFMLGDTMAAHSRAADWYLGTSDIAAVMHHLLAAGRLDDAAAYLTDHEAVIFSGGGGADQLLSWYDRMNPSAPDRILHLLRIGWGQVLSGDISAADATVARMTQELGQCTQTADDGGDPQQPGSLRSAQVAEAALLRAQLGVFHADPQAMVGNARRLLIEPTDHINAESEQLAPILIAKGLIWSGQPEAADRVLQATLVKPCPNDLLRETQLAVTAALSDVVNGYVRRARTRLDAVQRWMDHSGLSPDSRLFGPSWTVGAEVALELGDLDEAFRLAARGLADAQRSEVLGEVVWAQLVMARCHLVTGDFGAALRALVDAHQAATRDVADSAMAVVVEQHRAAVHLAAGDTGRAVRIIRSLPPSETRSLLWARAGLHQQPAVARRTLENVQAVSPRVEAQRHLLLATLIVRMSRRMAQGHLRKAGAIACRNGQGQLLASADPQVIGLVESTALEFQDDNLQWLLAVRADPRRVTSQDAPTTSLSRGELQLLALLPTRSKNADIAQGLGVSINTVKTRLRRLYAKLGANNRDEAIDIARSRGLLQ